MLKKLFNSLIYRIQKKNTPQMIGGLYSKGKVGVRISNHSHVSFPNNLTIGNNVFIGHFNYIDCYQAVEIGEGVQITNYCSILTHSSHHAIRLYGRHYSRFVNQLKGLELGPVSIGSYTYIGAHAVIMPNTILGKGVIVGAFSYVKSGTYPDFVILRGIPAKIIGDSRYIDNELLEKYPDLKAFYYLSNSDENN
jgi:acetyltransferase-like isoleucine patch superfamily enzyme